MSKGAGGDRMVTASPLSRALWALPGLPSGNAVNGEKAAPRHVVLARAGAPPVCLAKSLAVLQHVLDALEQRRDVLWLDGHERRHAQLVATQLAVRLHVDHAVGAQRLGHHGGID